MSARDARRKGDRDLLPEVADLQVDGHRRIATQLVVQHRPRGRPWTAIEALLQLDFDRSQGVHRPLREYMSMFGRSSDWVRTRICEFAEHRSALKSNRSRHASHTNRSPTVQPSDADRTETGHFLETIGTEPNTERGASAPRRPPAARAQGNPRSELPLEEITRAFAAYRKLVRTWAKPRRELLRARLREHGAEALVSAVHGYVYLHRRSGDGFNALAHLTPETVFRASNFGKYLDAAHAARDAGQSPPFSIEPVSNKSMTDRAHRLAREGPRRSDGDGRTSRTSSVPEDPYTAGEKIVARIEQLPKQWRKQPRRRLTANLVQKFVFQPDSGETWKEQFHAFCLEHAAALNR